MAIVVIYKGLSRIVLSAISDSDFTSAKNAGFMMIQRKDSFTATSAVLAELEEGRTISIAQNVIFVYRRL